jgi:NAD(P)-dependent dehydrogenase (short-subunit alcohol dehydrogenase family)
VVTGAGRGLGRSIASALAAEGMSLLLLSRTGSEVNALAEELAARHGVRAFPAAVDVTDRAAVDRVVMHAEQHLGTVDLLVNNAATIETHQLPFWEADVEDVWRVVETNLRGPLLLTRALLPPMVQRGHGRVVNIASRARAATRSGTYTGYAVSKRALSLLTESLTEPLRGTGVVAVDVLPGLVRTGLTLSMPVWADVTEWDSPTLAATVVADVAAGLYDDRHGVLLDAPALAAGR